MSNEDDGAPNTDADVVSAHEFAAQALAAPTWCHLFPSLPQIDARVTFEMAGRVARKVRGRKMPTWERLYDEFASAWQFGDYFGENINAFDECMRDLHDQWSTTEGFVVVITEIEQLLSGLALDRDAAVRQVGYLVDSFSLIAEDYAEPIEGPDWDPTARPALGFDVVLVADEEHRDSVIQTWRAAGAPLWSTDDR